MLSIFCGDRFVFYWTNTTTTTHTTLPIFNSNQAYRKNGYALFCIRIANIYSSFSIFSFIIITNLTLKTWNCYVSSDWVFANKNQNNNNNNNKYAIYVHRKKTYTFFIFILYGDIRISFRRNQTLRPINYTSRQVECVWFLNSSNVSVNVCKTWKAWIKSWMKKRMNKHSRIKKSKNWLQIYSS